MTNRTLSDDNARISLTSQWFVRPGCDDEALAAVKALAEAVRKTEPRTLMYRVHTPYPEDTPPSLPSAIPNSLLFIEEYADIKAFQAHVHGAVFTHFVQEHGHLFVQANGVPFTTVQFLVQRAGFVRSSTDVNATFSGAESTPNRHPAVMFEVIANDQQRVQAFYAAVFDWTYSTGTGGFSYVRFPPQSFAPLGGVGQANPSIPGFEPGHSFYLQVDDLESTIARTLAAGGSSCMPITNIDGYRFAMVRDPEGNPIGLIEPFAGGSRTTRPPAPS